MGTWEYGWLGWAGLVGIPSWETSVQVACWIEGCARLKNSRADSRRPCVRSQIRR